MILTRHLFIHLRSKHLPTDQTCHALATAAKPIEAADAPVNAALFKLAAARIKAHYGQANPGLLPVGTSSVGWVGVHSCWLY